MRSRSNRAPCSVTQRACSSTSAKSMTVYCERSAGTCSKRSGRVQRATAPSPITAIRPPNELIVIPPFSALPRHGILSSVEGDRLALGADTMRTLGYRTVDMLVERVLDESAPPLRRATPAEMRARISGPPPSEPQPFDELLRR